MNPQNTAPKEQAVRQFSLLDLCRVVTVMAVICAGASYIPRGLWWDLAYVAWWLVVAGVVLLVAWGPILFLLYREARRLDSHRR